MEPWILCSCGHDYRKDDRYSGHCGLCHVDTIYPTDIDHVLTQQHQANLALLVARLSRPGPESEAPTGEPHDDGSTAPTSPS